MRVFAAGWLITAFTILNLTRLPSTGSILAMIVLLLLLVTRVRQARSIAAGVLFSMVTLSIGFYQISLHQLPAALVSKDVVLTIKVISVPQRDDRRVSFLAQVLKCDSCVVPVGIKKVRLSWYGSASIVQAGERWRLTVRLKPLGGLRNAGGFDAVKWSLSKKLYATGYVRDHATAKRLTVLQLDSLSGFRESVLKSLQSLPSADESLSLIAALTLGIRSSVPDETWSLLRNTGTSHLLAISGLHISLVAAWALIIGQQVLMLFARISGFPDSNRLDPRSFGLMFSVFAALGYAALAGFELPTQRAVAMLSVWSIACLRYRILSPAAGLALALIFVMVQNPLNPLSVGFWLSFGTVAALFFLHRGHQLAEFENHEILGRRAKLVQLGRRARLMLRTHIYLGIVLLPVSAWFFQSGSLVAPLANMLAVPWVGLVCVPLSLATVLLSASAPVLADALLVITQWSLQLLIWMLRLLDNVLSGAPTLTVPNGMAMGVTLAGLMVLFGPKGLSLRWLAAPLFIPMFVFNHQPAQSEGFDIHVLDVGQGLATLVFTKHQTLLFDTGGRISPQLSMFEAAVMPFLHARGRRSIDTLVLSHLDDDHAFGLPDVLRRFPDIQIFTSRMPAGVGAGHDIEPCLAGEQWQSDGVSFSFLHPSHPNGQSANNQSCVLLIHQGQSRALFTGDIEKFGEARLLNRIGSDSAAFKVQLMVAPHHGSGSSSGQKLLDYFQPEFVVFAAGKRNRYAFPHADVQLRYKMLGAKAFTTGEQGTVSFSFGVEGLRKPPETWWHSHRRFWHGIVNPDCWQLIAGQSQVLRLLKLAQKGQILCGK